MSSIQNLTHAGVGRFRSTRIIDHLAAPFGGRTVSRSLGTSLALLAAGLLSGCATVWSDAQKSKLAPLAVPAPTLAADAFHDPDAKDSPGYSNSIPQATGGGLIPALIGSAIDAHITSKQQREFEEGNSMFFGTLRTSFSQDPVSEVHRALNQSLAGDPFFGSQISETAAARLTTEVLRYGLAKSPLSQDEDILLRVRIVAELNLRDATGRSLVKTQLSGVASNAKRAAEILEDPDFIRGGLAEAADDLAAQLQGILDLKLGRQNGLAATVPQPRME